MGFGARLKEERRRLGLTQAEFAALVGTDMPKQSLYERDQRQLRAAYLARLEPAGVDVLYVVTGQRSEGFPLGGAAAAFITTYMNLPDEVREQLQRFLANLAEYVERGPRPTGLDP